VPLNLPCSMAGGVRQVSGDGPNRHTGAKTKPLCSCAKKGGQGCLCVRVIFSSLGRACSSYRLSRTDTHHLSGDASTKVATMCIEDELSVTPLRSACAGWQCWAMSMLADAQLAPEFQISRPCPQRHDWNTVAVMMSSTVAVEICLQHGVR
jgi:hypothetical protein